METGQRQARLQRSPGAHARSRLLRAAAPAVLLSDGRASARATDPARSSRTGFSLHAHPWKHSTCSARAALRLQPATREPAAGCEKGNTRLHTETEGRREVLRRREGGQKTKKKSGALGRRHGDALGRASARCRDSRRARLPAKHRFGAVPVRSIPG